MDPEVVAALISASGVFVSLLVTIVFNALASKFNYRKLFAETVSQNRMDWINVWRENVSVFLAASRVLHDFQYKAGPNFDEYVFRQQQAKAMVTTRLNLTENLHQEFLIAINAVDFRCTDEKKFSCACEMVEVLARKILKPEWERVKEEAKGRRK